MNSEIKRIVSVLCLVAALFSAMLLPTSGSCENLRFVVLGDSPAASIPPNPTPSDLINTAVLNPIITQILALSPRPSFAVFTGDQALSGCFNIPYYHNPSYPYYLFQTWKDVMSPLTKAGIKLYTALGNRELFNPTRNLSDIGTFYLANQQEYQLAFNGNPTNGPSGYEHLVYSFESPEGDAFFAVLDPYYLTTDVPNPNPSGTIDSTQLNWLAAQLAQTKATHKFLFIHTPYYYVTSSSDEGGSPDSTFTQLWSILDNNHFDLYCCGHIHLYSRKAIDSSIAPNPQLNPPVQWHNNVVQLQDGTAGAPIVTDPPVVPDPASWHISQAADTYYFSVVDISGSQVTVNSYSYNRDTGACSVFDNFTIDKAPIPGVNSLLLN